MFLLVSLTCLHGKCGNQEASMLSVLLGLRSLVGLRSSVKPLLILASLEFFQCLD